MEEYEKLVKEIDRESKEFAKRLSKDEDIRRILKLAFEEGAYKVLSLLKNVVS